MRASSGASAKPSYWQGRTQSHPIPREQAVRQGEISRFAFEALGREAAMTFLNQESEALGARPLTLATQSADGAAKVKAEIARMGTSDTVKETLVPDTRTDVTGRAG